MYSLTIKLTDAQTDKLDALRMAHPNMPTRRKYITQLIADELTTNGTGQGYVDGDQKLHVKNGVVISADAPKRQIISRLKPEKKGK